MLEIVRLRETAYMRKKTESKEELKEKNDALKNLRYLQNQREINNALKFAESMLIKNYTDFDQKPYLIGCANGVLDLQTGELRPPKSSDMILKSIRIPYVPYEYCINWIFFLNEIFLRNQELINFIQRAIGYTLTGSVDEQCIFICYGKGLNGKSTFLNVIDALLQEYGISTPSSTLKKRYKDEPIPNDVARMCGKRFIKCVEIKENSKLNEERIKVLTGGDRISARFLHKEFFDFYPTGKIWLAVNHLPDIEGSDEAIWRRIKKIPFDAYFPPKKRKPQEKILEKLKAELPGIFAWAVEGCLEWRKRGLDAPEEVKRATKELK